MYLLWLYHHRNLDSTSPDEAINLKDITSVLNKVNQSLSKVNDTKNVAEKLNVELEIIDTIVNKPLEKNDINQLYYKAGLLSFEEKILLSRKESTLLKTKLYDKNIRGNHADYKR